MQWNRALYAAGTSGIDVIARFFVFGHKTDDILLFGGSQVGQTSPVALGNNQVVLNNIAHLPQAVGIRAFYYQRKRGFFDNILFDGVSKRTLTVVVVLVIFIVFTIT